MKKKLYIILGAIVVLLGVAYLIVIFFIGAVVTHAVNKYGPQLTGTPVTLVAAHISPFSGEGTLDTLTVGNPPGWSGKDAFKLVRIHVQVEPRSLFTNHIVIDEIEIDGPQFFYETRIISSNIGQLVSNIEGQKNNGAAQAKSNSGETKRFEIKHLVIRNGKLSVGVSGRAAVPLDMPTVEFHDLGTGEGGVTSSQLAALVGETLLKTILDSSAKAIGKLGGGAAGAATDLLKNLFNR